jgi:hypothetical protein
MENTTSKQLTAAALKDALWETLNAVKSGNMQAGQADSIATQAREILRTTTVQLKISAQSKRDIPAEVIAFSETK